MEYLSKIFQIKNYKRLTEKNRPHFLFFVPTSKTYIHSVCPNAWGFHKIAYILIRKLEAAENVCSPTETISQRITLSTPRLFKITWENVVLGT